MKYMETTTWEVCSFIGVLLQKSGVLFGLLQAGRGEAYWFYRSCLYKKAECFLCFTCFRTNCNISFFSGVIKNVRGGKGRGLQGVRKTNSNK